MGMPNWTMNDDGTITASSLAHERDLLYTFVETAIAHNEVIFSVKRKEAAKDFKEKLADAEDKVPQKIKAGSPVTKAEINHVLAGMYTPSGVKSWWYRPRKILDNKTPTEAWEIDPDSVVKIFRAFFRDDSEE